MRIRQNISFWMWLGKVAPAIFLFFIGISLVLVVKAGAIIFGLVN